MKIPKAEQARELHRANPRMGIAWISMQVGLEPRRVRMALARRSRNDPSLIEDARKRASGMRTNAPTYRAVREMSKSSGTWTAYDVREAAGCAYESARRAIAAYVAKGWVEVVRAPVRGQSGIYRGKRERVAQERAA